MKYNLELERVADLIKTENAKKICIQLPDGLKPKAGKITEFLKTHTNADIFIWAGSCFGACDIPHLPKDFDLLIQWGHSRWKSK